jgi:AmpD protein
MDSVSGIVIHYFSGKYQFPDDPFDPTKCHNLFKDLNRPTEEREYFKMEDVPGRMYASAHFMIDRDGIVYDLVPLPHKAWHAGTSEWQGKDNCNNWMVGIEMIATHDSGYTDDQYLALDSLTEQLIMEYGVQWDNITGHENIAPGRKQDPGPEFNWERYRLLGNF